MDNEGPSRRVEEIHDDNEDISSVNSDEQCLWDLLTVQLLQEQQNSLNFRMPCRDCKLDGPGWIHDIFTKHPIRVFEQTRLHRRTFFMLRNILRDGGFYVEDYRARVEIDEVLFMFLYMMSGDHRTRDMCERFQHSPETIMRNTKKMARAICNFSRNIIVPRNQQLVHQKIRSNRKLYPYFKVRYLMTRY